MRKHVGVVVGTGEPGGEQVVAQRGAHAVHLVGRQLLALPAAAEHDAEVGLAVAHGATDRRAERRVVDGFGAVGAEVGHVVSLRREHADEVLLQLVPGVVGADGDSRHPPSLRSAAVGDRTLLTVGRSWHSTRTHP